jgi:NCS1 family nucleobase:cation symporter-1
MGLPGTMMFYSFTGIFVTFAALIAFPDILVGEDAPWDPVNLVSRFQNPWVVVFAQLSMLIATLSTNIAANIIAPAYAISNLSPGKISFRTGGVLAGVVGILSCPWWLLNEISEVLMFVSALLGPVLGVLLCDYFLIRKTKLEIADLFNPKGPFSYGGSGINMKAMFSLLIAVLAALVGNWVPALSFLFSLSWFTGFSVSFGVYYLLSKAK